jgi:hypothetical protein
MVTTDRPSARGIGLGLTGFVEEPLALHRRCGAPLPGRLSDPPLGRHPVVASEGTCSSGVARCTCPELGVEQRHREARVTTVGAELLEEVVESDDDRRCQRAHRARLVEYERDMQSVARRVRGCAWLESTGRRTGGSPLSSRMVGSSATC